MSRTFTYRRARWRPAWLCIAALVCAGTAAAKTIEKLSSRANPPQYAAFSQPLPKGERYLHVLDRLTFGPRPGDLEQAQRIGLKKWLDLQLHPERIPENPALASRLRPFQSLRLGIEADWQQYHTDRRLKRQAKQPDPNRSAELAAILDPAQVVTLEHGKPVQKVAVLASINAAEWPELAHALAPAERRQLIPLAPAALRRELLFSTNPPAVLADDLEEAKLLRAIYGNRQLQELLVDFWYNHFNVFWGKGRDRFLVADYVRNTIRPHVLGKFYDLLLATAESPAMLFYLDNWQSVGPASVAALHARRRNLHGINENYGRELMELHTIGVNGGYTQKDVIEVARCFTGWTIAPLRRGGGFVYNDRMHDKGRKVVLGHVIPAGGGMNDGLEVLKILARSPETAHRISFELAQRFVADDPPPSLVNRMARTFLRTDGDLRRVMETMIDSPAFWSEGAYRAKVKTPFELVVSAARATNADVDSAFALARATQIMGEPLYRKVDPNGYSNSNRDWVSSAGLLDRMNFSLALAQNRIPGVRIDAAAWSLGDRPGPEQIEQFLLGQPANAQTEEDIQQTLEKNRNTRPQQVLALVAGLTLGSPEFQRR